jgi:hypothetical protein
MLSKQEEQAERLEVLENEKRLKGTTLSRFGQSEADTPRGRFSEQGKSTQIGSTPNPASQYPKGPAWTAADQGTELSLGVDINKVEPCG